MIYLGDVQATQVRDLLRRYVPAGFRDEDGVWHEGVDGAKRAAALALLVPAGTADPEREAQVIPVVTPQAFNDPIRPVWYRIHRDTEYEPSNVEARFLCARIRELEGARDSALTDLRAVRGAAGSGAGEPDGRET